MPSFVSKEGTWIPAKEIAHGIENKTGKTLDHEYLINSEGGHVVKPGEKFMYNGPDREAVKMLAEANEAQFGHNFRNDPEFLQATRNMNFHSVDEYLKAIGYDSKKAQDDADKKADTTINKHNLPQRAKEIKAISGGRSTAGDFIGGFGDERLRESKELAETTTAKK